MLIKLSAIKGLDRRVRKQQSPEKLDELADSIKELGLIVPVKVRQNGEGYTLVYGHRRVAAAKMAGLKEIEAIVEGVTDTDLLVQSLVENLVREDMGDVDKRNGIRRLHDEYGMTYEEIAAPFGHKKEWAIDLANITDEEAKILSTIDRATETKDVRIGFGMRHVLEARAGTKDEKLAVRVLQKAGEEGLSTRQTRQVADVVRSAAAFGGEKAVKRVLAQPYESIKETTDALEAGELIPSQARKATRQDWRAMMSMVDHALHTLDTALSKLVASKEGKAVIKTICPRWIKVLERLVRILKAVVEA